VIADKQLTGRWNPEANPDVISRLKINAAEQVRNYLTSQGLTVNWILGGVGA
jgi:hypothetical protein